MGTSGTAFHEAMKKVAKQCGYNLPVIMWDVDQNGKFHGLAIMMIETIDGQSIYGLLEGAASKNLYPTSRTCFQYVEKESYTRIQACIAVHHVMSRPFCGNIDVEVRAHGVVHSHWVQQQIHRRYEDYDSNLSRLELIKRGWMIHGCDYLEAIMPGAGHQFEAVNRESFILSPGNGKHFVRGMIRNYEQLVRPMIMKYDMVLDPIRVAAAMGVFRKEAIA